MPPLSPSPYPWACLPQTGGGAKDLLLNGRRASVRAGTLRRGKAAQQEGNHKAPVILDGGCVPGAAVNARLHVMHAMHALLSLSLQAL